MGSGEMGELEDQLLEAGKVLLQPRSSADELLTHLDRVGQLLRKVEQSPSKSMLRALSPTIKAVVEEELLRNQNEDVRVAVASCISEITRITAPDAPYDDNQMKEVFQLIISSFENLADDSSQSYSKRTSILETVAKVRSCVVMLDLECDDLIVEMFQHFLKAIRDHHPENVFSSMEIIMTLVLEESEDIGLELISPILASLKKDNQEVQPIARKLAENVIGKCAAKTKKGAADEAASREATQDQVTKESEAETLDGRDCHASMESVPGEDLSSSMEAGPEEGRTVLVETDPGEDNPAPGEASPGEEHLVPVESGVGEDLSAPATPPKSATSITVVETENEDVSAGPHSSEKQELTNEEDRPYSDANMGDKAEPVDLDHGKVGKVESKSAQASKKRSKNPKHSMNSAEGSESVYSDMDLDKEAKCTTDGDIILDKEFHASPCKDPSAEVDVHKENKIEIKQLSSPKALESEPENVFSPSPSGSALDECRSAKGGHSKNKKDSIEKASPSVKVANMMETEGTNNSEVKIRGPSGKKPLVSDSPAGKAQVSAKTSKVEWVSASYSDVKLVKKSTRKADTRNCMGDGSSSKKKVFDERHAHGKATFENVESVSSPKPSKVIKDDSPLEEAPKTNSKRKLTPSQEKETFVKKYGEDLVGAKIKVWWPMDKMFYEGVVDSFDSKKKKHKVLYADGDLELLNLGNEKWELIKDDSMEDGDQETIVGGPDTSPVMQKKKKAKTGSETSAKKGKTVSLQDSEASSSKSKGTAPKSGCKYGRLVEVTPKSIAKSEEVVGKSKVSSKKSSGKSSADASEKAGMFKDLDNGTARIRIRMVSLEPVRKGTPKIATKDDPKTATKENPKNASKDSPKTGVKDSARSGSKGTTSKSGSNSGSSSPDKVKSGLAKSKETKEMEKTLDMVKTSKSGKEKLAETSKGKESVGKSGKKQRRS